MAKRPRFQNRRFPIGLPFILDVRLSLFSHVLGRTRTNLSEEFVTDRLTKNGDWQEIQRLLIQEAELRGIPLEDLLREALEKDGFADRIDFDGVDLSILLDVVDPLESEEEE